MLNIKQYASKNAKSIRNLAIAGLTSLILATSGCATVNGIAKDTRDFSGWVADSTQSYVDKRDETELVNAEKKRQMQIDKAAALINSRYQAKE